MTVDQWAAAPPPGGKSAAKRISSGPASSCLLLLQTPEPVLSIRLHHPKMKLLSVATALFVAFASVVAASDKQAPETLQIGTSLSLLMALLPWPLIVLVTPVPPLTTDPTFILQYVHSPSQVLLTRWRTAS